MALRFIENFYQYGEVGTNLADANSNFNTGWIVHSGGDVAAVINTGFRANAKSVLLDRTLTGSARIERRFTTDSDLHIVGYAFRATQRGAATLIIEGGDEEIVKLNWPNQFEVNGVLGNATILLNKVWFVEVKLERSTKKIVVHVNGHPHLETTTPHDIPESIQCIWGYEEAGPNATMVMSDVSYVDATPGGKVDFMGAQMVIARPITSAAGDNWDVEPEDGDRVAIMNNIPANPAEYTESDQVGSRDMYLSTAEIPDERIINGVAITSLLTKTDIDEQKVAMVIKDDTMSKLSPDVNVPLQPTYMQQVFETDAQSQAWTKASVEASEFGIEIRPRT